MFETIKKKINESNEENSPKNMSLDFKLMFVFHIAMMILLVIRPIDNAQDQVIFSLILASVLVAISIGHKMKNKWSWPGLKIMSIPGVIFNLLFLYVFFAFTAYAMTPNTMPSSIELDSILTRAVEALPVIVDAIFIPAFTPWYMAGLGIFLFNILSSLNLTTQKKSEFEAQCENS
tara:strand:- start:235 stop:762 length:528 start_codon:yes stop_codon:yes gene_type:complete